MTGPAGRVEMALAPDRAADPLSWDWTPLTDSAKVTTLAISRGQTSSGANEAQPSSMSFPLLNPGGVHTPGRADSLYYPNLRLGTPVRAVVEGLRDPYLALTGDAGSRCSTPDNAALDVVGDLSVAVEFECPLRVPPDESTYWELAAKWDGTTNLSWRLLLSPIGSLTLEWTTGGTTATLGFFDGRLGIPRPDAGILTVGFNLDVDNGASGRTITWYVVRGGTIADLVADPASYVHETQTGAGTTSIFSSTATLQLGDNSGSSSNPPAAAKVRRMIMRSGTMAAGTIVANPTFTAETPGGTSFTDSAGRVWTVNSPASITDDQVRMVGELASNSPRWPAYDVDEVAQTEWSVLGPLSRMRQGEKPIQSALYRRVTAPRWVDDVVAYWPLEDGSESLSAFSPIAGVQPMNIGGGTGWRFASDSTLPASEPLPHTDNLIAFAGTVPPYSATQTRVDMYVRIDTPNPQASGATSLIGIDTTGTAARWTLAIDDTNVAVFATDSFGNSVVSSTWPSDARFFNVWCLWSFHIAQNAGNVDWKINVVPIPLGLAFGAGSAGGASGSFAGTVGTATVIHNWLTAAPLTDGISFGHLIVTTGLPLGWLAPADTAFSGEPAGRRFFRLCQEHGIQGLVDGVYSFFWADALAAGAKPMGPQRPAKFLDLLQECSLVENARIGESKELLGALTYRSDQYTQDPALTITGELGNPFEPTDDTQGLANDVVVSMPSGSSHRQVDQDSVDALGLYESSREVNAHAVLQLPDLTSWWLHESLWPDLRVPVLKVELGKTPALFDSWLALSMRDLVRITTPVGYPEPMLDVLVDGYTEELSQFHWALTLNVSPAGPWEVGVRDDADLGIRDTGGSVLDAAFVAGTDTTMDVETTLGPLWAVTAASNSALPFDVNVGGARVTVTAVGAAAGQVQTFTVTQTPVNGITKTVPAGTPVRVWRPARRALVGATNA